MSFETGYLFFWALLTRRELSGVRLSNLRLNPACFGVAPFGVPPSFCMFALAFLAATVGLFLVRSFGFSTP
jgi:hypothetical protein